MAVRSTQGQNRAVRSTQGGRGVSPSYMTLMHLGMFHPFLGFLRFKQHAAFINKLHVITYGASEVKYKSGEA